MTAQQRDTMLAMFTRFATVEQKVQRDLPTPLHATPTTEVPPLK